MQKTTLALLACATLLAGCGMGGFRLGFPGVYKIDIPQGNIVNQQMVDKLQPGMTKRQVRFVMGTPLIIDTFEPERWDYLRSIDRRGKGREQERVSLYFQGDLLVRIEGDLAPAGAPAPAAATPAEATPSVPTTP
jgi:outer membrane protein assembly factor BamE